MFFLQKPNNNIHQILEEKMNNRIYIWEMHIFEKYRNKGYGYKLLSQLLDDRHEYFLQVQKDNIPAIKLYQKLGFEFYKESIRKLDDKIIIRYIMIRKKKSIQL